MKTLSCCVLGFSLATCTVCYGQIDIFQSDAYSVEEMCAREAEQNTNYTEAYESCISQNSAKPMYQAEHNGVDSQIPDTNSPDDQTDAYNQDQNNPEYSQDQESY